MSNKKYQAFFQQVSNAERRGIEWLLSFEQWLQIWEESGHLHERGKKSAQYCMARFGDIGPYAISNVKIITNAENCSEGSSYPRSDETKRRMSASMKGKIRSEEHRRNLTVALQNKPPVTKETALKISLANRGKKRKPFTEETKQKIRLAIICSVKAQKEAGTYINPGRYRGVEVKLKGLPIKKEKEIEV